MKIIVRKAKNIERESIALCIAEAFEKDFSVLSKDIVTTAKAISSGIVIDKFYVAELNNKIVGVLAISNCNGRAVILDSSSYKKYFGFIKGIIAKIVLKEEFQSKLNYPVTTGYIEGVATTLIKESLKLSSYIDYVLDVTDINISAINCYNNLGFEEYKRVKEKHSKQKGFNEKIYMKYKK